MTERNGNRLIERRQKVDVDVGVVQLLRLRVVVQRVKFGWVNHPDNGSKSSSMENSIKKKKKLKKKRERNTIEQKKKCIYI